MRNVLKAETLERRFPLLSVENGCSRCSRSPPALGGERLHREQGRRPDRGFRGGAARVVHGDGGRV